MLKKYKAIFFDWDGTAVLSRKASAREAIEAMRPLLQLPAENWKVSLQKQNWKIYIWDWEGVLITMHSLTENPMFSKVWYRQSRNF